MLSRAGRKLLRQLACSSVLLAFDYDGTLAPIVRDPGRAAMRERTRRLLAELAALYPGVVVSGRARSDLRRRLHGIPLRALIGNHGIEPWHATRRLRQAVRRWLPLLARRLSGVPGVWIEDKGLSLAIHYRNSRAKALARAAILEAAASLGPTRVIGGKQVVNILPPAAPNKGIAVERARDRLGCDSAVYLGDDDTDEDVFALDRPGRLLGVRVGAKRTSRAGYYVRNQLAVDDLLALLVRLRKQAR